MKRRTAFGAAAWALLAWLETAAAASHTAAATPRRIGWLSPSSAAQSAQVLGYFRRAMAELGAQEGRDYRLDIRLAELDVERLPALAAELVALAPSVVVALGPGIDAMLKASPTVPVVGLGELANAAIRAGHATPPARLTGVSLVFDSLNVKRLEVLAQVMPAGAGLVVLGAPLVRDAPNTLEVLELARRRFGLKVHTHFGLEPEDMEAAFELAKRRGAAGLLMLNHPVLHSRRTQVIALAQRARLPVMYQWPQSAREGGLFGYGPDTAHVYPQLARLAWRIAQGTDPASLPHELPTRIVLAINMKTARAQGIRIPAVLLARADEVIE